MTQKLRTIRLLLLFRKRTPKGACLRLSYSTKKCQICPLARAPVMYAMDAEPVQGLTIHRQRRRRRRRLRGLHCGSLRPPTSSSSSSLFASCVPHPLSIADHAQIPQRARFSHSYSYLSLTEPKRQYKLTNLTREDILSPIFGGFPKLQAINVDKIPSQTTCTRCTLMVAVQSVDRIWCRMRLTCKPDVM